MDSVPKNIDAENAVLGAALAYRDSLPLLAGLTVDAFCVEGNKRIWSAILRLLADGKLPDPVLIAEESHGISMVDLALLIENACPTVSVPYYLEILREKERGRTIAARPGSAR